MKNNRNVLKAVAAAVLTVSAGIASAATATTGVTASITITSICKFSGAITLAFGTVDPSLVAGPLTASSGVTYNCTNGTTPTGLQAYALSGNMASGGNNIAYTLNDLSAVVPAAGTGFGVGQSKSLGTLTATVTQLAAQNASAGAYSSAITLSLDY
jgi:spore coat protein U-like protein